jgi:hypothetical protein
MRFSFGGGVFCAATVAHKNLSASDAAPAGAGSFRNVTATAVHCFLRAWNLVPSNAGKMELPRVGSASPLR